MQFGQPNPDPERAKSMRWDGTERRAREIQDWARDAALLPYAAVTPPDRNAADGTPEAAWSVKIKVEVAAAMGGGWQWEPVPAGASIVYTGTPEEPVFSVRTPRMAAQALRNDEE